MYRPLVPCPACERHIRTTETRCPFCAAPLPDDLARGVIPGTTRRLGRAALAVFASAIVGTACGGGSTNATTDPVVDPGASSGGAVRDPGPTGANPPAPADAGQATAAPDGGVPDGGPDDDGATVAEYGAPAPPEHETIAPAYGAPAFPTPIDPPPARRRRGRRGGLPPGHGAPAPMYGVAPDTGE